MGCQEVLQIDCTITGRPDYLPNGWQRLIVSNGFLGTKIIPAKNYGGWLCPKHYAELLSLLKKDEGKEQDTDTAPGKGLENEKRDDINVNVDSA